MSYTNIRVIVPNLKVFGPAKTELQAKELGKFSIMSYRKMGCWAYFSPPTWLPKYKCMEVLQTLNRRNSNISGYIALKLAETYQNGVIYIVKKFCPKSR